MVKMVSLSDEAYRRLKVLKGLKSFSELVIEITDERTRKKKNNLMDFFGIWKDDSEYWENFKKEIRKSRNNAKMREVRF